MELKSRIYISVRCSCLVLIAPLWNWNCISTPEQDGNAACSNRTFMELKFDKIAVAHLLTGAVLIAPLWNWNTTLHSTYWKIRSSNRTFMELKWRCAHVWNRQHQVLIVPLWNWNEGDHQAHRYQHQGSNRTFMELKFCD